MTAVVLAGISGWHFQIVAAIFQGLGVAFTALGIAAIGDRVRRARGWAAAKMAETRSIFRAWAARRREELARLWARVTHKPQPQVIRPAGIGSMGGVGTPTVSGQRNRVDRDTISARDWLARLDDDVETLFRLLADAEKRRSDELQVVYSRIGVQREQLRAEIIRETRNGWQLVAWGLLYTLIGVVVGAFA